MADRIAIFRGGRLEQFDTPDTILARPASPFIAGFVGADRALKRLRLVRARDALSACECAARVGDSSARARALLERHGVEQIVLLDAAGKPQGYLGAAELGAIEGTLMAAHARPLQGVARDNDDLRSVISSMFALGQSWLPTVDDEGRFVGYVNQAHIVDMLRLPAETCA
jgi:osmoprotectant transport system ATP-binding protein